MKEYERMILTTVLWSTLIIAAYFSLFTFVYKTTDMAIYISALFILLTVLGTILMLIKKKPSATIQSYASTLGVLGTFVGVYLGLMNFDESDISASVPTLLSGLKTAFSTSIAGMIASLLVKLFYFPKQEETLDEDAKRHSTTLEALNGIALGINKSIAKMDSIAFEMKVVKLRDESFQNSLAKSIEEVTDSIKSGTSIIDSSLNSFAEKLAEQSSKELIASIQRVMDDFNAKINSQLGEEFKDLSDSTKNLNLWQQENAALLEKVKQYSIQQVEKMEELSKTFGLLEQIREYMCSLELYMRELHNTGNNLGNVIPAIQNEIDTINISIAKTTSFLLDITNNVCLSLKSCSSQIESAERNIQRSSQNFDESVTNTMRELSTNFVGILKKAFEEIDALKKRMH